MPHAFPDFIIVGAMKCATTSLHRLLKTHPEIYIKRNEIRFFNRDHEYAQGAERYWRLLRGDRAEGRKLGEDSPTYHHVESVPARIAAHHPGVKLIWILRDPIARAQSQYWHAVRNGTEWRGFGAAARAELAGRPGDPRFPFLEMSRYPRQIRRYLDHFPPEAMLFLPFDAVAKGERAAIDRVTSFLDVSRFDAIEMPHANRSAYARFPVLNLGFAQIRDRNARIRRARAFHTRWSSAAKHPIDAETLRRLTALFAEEMAETRALTGLELPLGGQQVTSRAPAAGTGALSTLSPPT